MAAQGCMRPPASALFFFSRSLYTAIASSTAVHPPIDKGASGAQQLCEDCIGMIISFCKFFELSRTLPSVLTAWQAIQASSTLMR